MSGTFVILRDMTLLHLIDREKWHLHFIVFIHLHHKHCFVFIVLVTFFIKETFIVIIHSIF